MKVERWECVECGSPCRIEIYYSDAKLPEHLLDEDKFRNKECLCKNSPSTKWTKIVWKEDENVSPSPEQ